MQKHHRGERRHQTERLKKKRQFYWGYHPSSPFQNRRQMSDAVLGLVVTTAAVCSCALCGHQARRTFGNGWQGKTLRELSDLELCKKNLI